MNESPDVSECPACHAALQPLPEYAHCPTCGLIVTDDVAAVEEMAAMRETLVAATTRASSLNYPNALATLNEGAWWQLADGHAVHFTTGSLARFVRAERFAIFALAVSEDGRLIHLKATRAAAPSRPVFDLEDDLPPIAAAVEAFPAAMERQVVRWRRVIEETLGEGHGVVICGSDAIAHAFLSKLQIDEARVGRIIDASQPPDVVIVLGDAFEEVRRELRLLGSRALVLTP